MSGIPNPILVSFALALAVMCVTSSAFADNNIDKTGLALQGYDPVAYFIDGKAVRGDFQLTTEHDGAIYRFATKKHKQMFMKEPKKYTPQFGGYCAYGVSIGAKFTADPTVFVIKNGKLYVNINPSIISKFKTDLDSSIRKADANWPKLADKPVSIKN